MNGEDPIANAIGAIVDAGQVQEDGNADLRRGSRVRDGRRDGARARKGGAEAVRRRPGRGGLAGRLRRLVAGDPNDDSVLIFLAHNILELEQLAEGIGLGVFGAITQFQALASTSPR